MKRSTEHELKNAIEKYEYFTNCFQRIKGVFVTASCIKINDLKKEIEAIITISCIDGRATTFHCVYSFSTLIWEA